MHGLLCILLASLVAMPAWADMPDTAALRVMVERRVEAATEPGLLEVIAFRRMGEAPDPAGSGRIAYFAARFRLTRAHDFGAWTGGNMPALAAACGAGLRAIQGAVCGGNAAGDEIRVNGALRLRQEDGAWAPLAASAAAAGAPPGIEQRNTQAERLLDAIGIALASGPRASGADATPIIEEELAAAWRSIEGRIARIDRGYAVAGGAPGSEYARLAQAMAGMRTGRSGVRVAALPSAGSAENLRLIAAGTATIGMASAGPAGASTLLPFGIPAHTYPGQDEPLPTLATTAVLVGTDALTSAEVDRILALLFWRPGIAEAGGPAALEIGRATASSLLPLPFHPGAEAFYARTDE
jgi:hypothetical protein